MIFKKQRIILANASSGGSLCCESSSSFHRANFKKQILKTDEIYIHASILIALNGAFSAGMFTLI
jgi:hypothetical protein